jgi:hypothetical protein
MDGPRKSDQVRSAYINAKKIEEALSKVPVGTVVKTVQLRIRFSIPYSQMILVKEMLSKNPNFYVSVGEVEVIKSPGHSTPS